MSGFSFYGKQDAFGDYDIIYYNANITNNRTLDRGSGQDPRVNFNETRDAPILHDASKYNLSVVRFTANGAGKELPIFVPVIDTNDTGGNPTYNVNQTIYKITLQATKGGNTYYSTQPLIWTPEDLDAKVPEIPNAGDQRQDFSTRYYHMTTFQRFVGMIRRAVVEAMAHISLQSGSAFQSAPPHFDFDPNTDLFSWSVDTYGWTDQSTSTGANEEHWQMFFDSNLHGLLANFNFEYQGGDQANDFKTYELLFRNDIVGAQPFKLYEADGTPAQTAGADTNYRKFTQDYASTSTLWCPIDSIVFTSTLLPCVKEFTGQPLEFGNSTDVPTGSTQNAFQPIITDIAVPMSSAYDYRGFIEYAPTAEYRMISLASSQQQINNIDIQLYWKSRLDGNLYPIRMYNLSNVSFKIMFRKKDYIS